MSNIEDAIPSNVIKTCLDSSEESIKIQKTNSSNNILNEIKNENNNNSIALISNSIINNNLKNESNFKSEESEKSEISRENEEIQPPEKHYSIPLNCENNLINNNSNNNVKNMDINIVRTFSTPALKYSSKTATSFATKTPNKNYNKSHITTNSILFNSDTNSNNVINTGIKINTQPIMLNNPNVVTIPFSPKSFNGSMNATSPISIQNKGLASPSITNATVTVNNDHTSFNLKYDVIFFFLFLF